uniref:Uncharacterized protein n=1 Tax=Cucumis melo TaxID=3656 RepID=A0A9I9EE81_CUCME
SFGVLPKNPALLGLNERRGIRVKLKALKAKQGWGFLPFNQFCSSREVLDFKLLQMEMSFPGNSSFRPHFSFKTTSYLRWNNKIQLLANLNLKETPQLVELVDDSKEVKELIGLALEKVLLKWMNFHLEKAGY